MTKPKKIKSDMLRPKSLDIELDFDDEPVDDGFTEEEPSDHDEPDEDQ